MPVTKKIREIIISTIAQIKEDNKKSVEIDSKTTLVGHKGILDSLELVNLIIAVEEKIEEEFDLVITLASEEAMSQENSPFRTVTTFTEYISLLLKRNENG